MKTDNIAEIRSDRVWLSPDACNLDDFATLVERTTAKADYPFAAEIAENMPVYDRAEILKAAASPETRKALTAEWIEAMTDGPGAVVMRGAFADTAAIDAATAHFNAIIAEQHATGTGGGDHFAKPGANDRIWNALEKLCLRDPEVFAAYYGNEIIALVSEAWLGPPTRSPRRSIASIPAARPRPRTATITSVSSPAPPSPAIRRTSTACRRC